MYNNILCLNMKRNTIYVQIQNELNNNELNF